MKTWKCLVVGLVFGLFAFSYTGLCLSADNGQIVI